MLKLFILDAKGVRSHEILGPRLPDIGESLIYILIPQMNKELLAKNKISFRRNIRNYIKNAKLESGISLAIQPNQVFHDIVPGIFNSRITFKYITNKIEVTARNICN